MTMLLSTWKCPWGHQMLSLSWRSLLTASILSQYCPFWLIMAFWTEVISHCNLPMNYSLFLFKSYFRPLYMCLQLSLYRLLQSPLGNQYIWPPLNQRPPFLSLKYKNQKRFSLEVAHHKHSYYHDVNPSDRIIFERNDTFHKPNSSLFSGPYLHTKFPDVEHLVNEGELCIAHFTFIDSRFKCGSICWNWETKEVLPVSKRYILNNNNLW